MIEPILAIELIFNLLCVCRQIPSASSQALRRAMYRRGLYCGTFDDLPRFSFWIRLCRSATLLEEYTSGSLDETSPPRPTLFVPDWLSLPLEEKILHLVEVWMDAPLNPGLRGIRHRLPKLLAAGRDLSPSYQKETLGLQALGLYDGKDLTTLGQALLVHQVAEFERPSPEAWQLFGDELRIPYPPDWPALWHLEAYLDPIDPGIYPLSEKAVRLAVQRGALDGNPALPQLLESGLDEPPPSELIKKMKAQPVLKVLTGKVLEFTSTKELTQLRESASMRRDLTHLLSPRHVHLDHYQADRILRRLHRRGLLAEKELVSPGSGEGEERQTKRPQFSRPGLSPQPHTHRRRIRASPFSTLGFAGKADCEDGNELAGLGST